MEKEKAMKRKIFWNDNKNDDEKKIENPLNKERKNDDLKEKGIPPKEGYT